MSPFYWIALAIIVVVSSSRLTRLATYDKFPPIAWLRDRYASWTDRTARARQWQLLAFCGYCASFWLTLLVVLTGLWCGVLDGHYNGTLAEKMWFLVNGSLAASYAAAILMAHDGEAEFDAELDQHSEGGN